MSQNSKKIVVCSIGFTNCREKRDNEEQNEAKIRSSERVHHFVAVVP